MSGDASTRVVIYSPAPDDMELDPAGDFNGFNLVIHQAVRIRLGDTRFTVDTAEEAAAMRHLSELAADAAGILEQRLAKERKAS